MPRNTNFTAFHRDEIRRVIFVYQYSNILKGGDDMKVSDIEKKLKNGYHGIGEGESDFNYKEIHEFSLHS